MQARSLDEKQSVGGEQARVCFESRHGIREVLDDIHTGNHIEAARSDGVALNRSAQYWYIECPLGVLDNRGAQFQTDGVITSLPRQSHKSAVRAADFQHLSARQLVFHQRAEPV